MAKKNEIAIAKSVEPIVASVSEDDIRGRIYTIRGVQVMLDKDLAGLYGVETKYINRAVKRNPNRFPDDFVFQLTQAEWKILKSQIETSRFQNGTLKSGRGSNLKYMPYVFTESGVGQLSAVLKSEVADYVSINIQRAFVAMRRYLAKNAGLLQRLENVELKQLETENWKKEVGERFEDILNRMDDGSLKHKLGVFFENQMFDAFVVVEELAKITHIQPFARSVDDCG